MIDNDKEKERVLNSIADEYQKKQEILSTKLDDFNRIRIVTGYQEIPDITQRSFNATTKSIKYFTDHNINCYKPYLKNYDQLAFVAWKNYVMEKYDNALLEIIYLEKEVIKINDRILESKEYKNRLRIRNIYKALTEHIPNTMYLLSPLTEKIDALKPKDYSDLFIPSKSHLDNYLKHGEEIIKLDPEKDLLKAFENELNRFNKEMLKNRTYENFYKNNEIQKVVYQQLLNVLLKLNKKEEALEFKKYYLLLMKNNIQEVRDNFEFQYNQFKKEINSKNKSLTKQKK